MAMRGNYHWGADMTEAQKRRVLMDRLDQAEDDHEAAKVEYEAAGKRAQPYIVRRDKAGDRTARLWGTIRDLRHDLGELLDTEGDA